MESSSGEIPKSCVGSFAEVDGIVSSSPLRYPVARSSASSFGQTPPTLLVALPAAPEFENPVVPVGFWSPRSSRTIAPMPDAIAHEDRIAAGNAGTSERFKASGDIPASRAERSVSAPYSCF